MEQLDLPSSTQSDIPICMDWKAHYIGRLVAGRQDERRELESHAISACVRVCQSIQSLLTVLATHSNSSRGLMMLRCEAKGRGFTVSQEKMQNE